jgi:hypothetical protein
MYLVSSFVVYKALPVTFKFPTLQQHEGARQTHHSLRARDRVICIYDGVYIAL